MQSTDWAPEHSAALRELLAAGLSYARIAEAINAKFRTSYSRNAALGRATRMGLAGSDRAGDVPEPERVKAPLLPKLREREPARFIPVMPVFKATETAKLRCVEVEPRHLSLLELGRGDCRYPYGGDEEGEPITFCGHPRRPGKSYCAPHFHLTRGTGAPPEPTAASVVLRLVEVA